MSISNTFCAPSQRARDLNLKWSFALEQSKKEMFYHSQESRIIDRTLICCSCGRKLTKAKKEKKTERRRATY